jgi:hypothetical protein
MLTLSMALLLARFPVAAAWFAAFVVTLASTGSI